MNDQLMASVIILALTSIFLFYKLKKDEKSYIDLLEAYKKEIEINNKLLESAEESLIEKEKELKKLKPKTAQEDMQLINDLMSNQQRTLIEIRRISPDNMFMLSPKDS